MDRQIGAQFYTLRETLKTVEDFEETCRRVKEIGYKIVQISGTPLKAADMRPILDKYGLKVVTTHRVFEDFLKDLDEIIAYNKTLGCELCGIGGMPTEYRGSKEGIDRFIKAVNEVAKKLRAAGMYFGYHNHAFEFIKYDGKCIMDRLIEETDPDNVCFIVDTYWIQVGGRNPVELIHKMGKRAMAIHYKDVKATLDNTAEMAEVGEGNLNWGEITKACDEAGSRWALVELDRCKRDPFDAMKISYDYLTSIGFN